MFILSFINTLVGRVVGGLFLKCFFVVVVVGEGCWVGKRAMGIIGHEFLEKTSLATP